MQHTILPLGEAGLLVRFGEGIHPEVHRAVKALSDVLADRPFPGLIDTVISYTSLAVYYDPFRVLAADEEAGRRTAFSTVSAYLEDECLPRAGEAVEKAPRVVRVPVCYGGAYGPDLPFVAAHAGLPEEEVIRLHTAQTYLVYMIGFCPGFPYLGGMDRRIAAPRRQTPRLAIPARSVGIAGEQTGVYPMETPGGWQIIGRTALELFRPEDERSPSLLAAGDLVQFYPVTEAEYLAERKEQP